MHLLGDQKIKRKEKGMFFTKLTKTFKSDSQSVHAKQDDSLKIAS